jgi:hypothetical protein
VNQRKFGRRIGHSCWCLHGARTTVWLRSASRKTQLQLDHWEKTDWSRCICSITYLQQSRQNAVCSQNLTKRQSSHTTHLWTRREERRYRPQFWDGSFTPSQQIIYTLHSLPKQWFPWGYFLGMRKRLEWLHVSSLFYFTLAEISGVARDSRKSERIRVICLSPGSE